ncbi:Phage head-tail joining protein [Pseudooceanicola marinus]|uniref:Phage head-tail joining protein n=1 Tax=Pseudooceanicola marinus TaxID=396013 RepID=A0A1X7A4B3_9RHOB|nr:head-tail adaptor protein [Pseudooceanicola marinus]PJE27150.1 head-tail adaptor protein [Pseudooceanicola marinus]SLN70332.1 Phage head-tail joining protein [Pseudooceanicola marinus]
MIGALDQRIRLERKVEQPDGAGGRRETWSAFADDPEPWARVALDGSTEREARGRKILVQSAVFTLRARSDVRGADRIVWDGRAWEVVSIGTPVARARYIKVSAVAGEV